MIAHVLLIDDDRNLREVVAFMLSEAGHQVTPAGSAEEGLALFATRAPDLVITDMRMPGKDGMHVLEHVAPSGVPVIMLTAHGTVSQAVEAMRLGASSYLLKPFEKDELVVNVGKALAESALRRDNAQLRDLLQRRQADAGLVYRSEAMAGLVEQARHIAASDAPVLITGDSGTGKELLARLVHQDSPRWQNAFVAVNCGAIPQELAESELFGHRKGAFTGADRDHPGRLRAAHGGTLFLDEVGELPAALQAKFLRALENRQVDPVGGTGPEDVDFRLVAATNRDLQAEVAAGGFREDLFYRLAVVVLHLPPLRRRPEDIDPLWDHFTRLHHDGPLETSQALRQVLRGRPWPGNVRELRNLNQRLVLLRRGDVLEVSDLERIESGQPSRPVRKEEGILEGLPGGGPTGDLPPGDLPPGGLDLRALERRIIESALARFDGNKSRAAAYLGLPRHVLIYRLKKFAQEDAEQQQDGA